MDIMENGYSKNFVDGVIAIKNKYGLNSVAIAYPKEGIAEFLFLCENDCDIKTLAEVSDLVTSLVDSLFDALELSEDVGVEVSMCDFKDIPENSPGLIYL